MGELIGGMNHIAVIAGCFFLVAVVLSIATLYIKLSLYRYFIKKTVKDCKKEIEEQP